MEENINNIRRITYVIPESFSGKYLKDFLYSRGYSTELVKHLKATVNLDAFHILRQGEHVTIDIIENEKSDIEPNPDLPLDIVYEDDDMLLVNKPKDMPTHPSKGNVNNTLGNAVVNHFKNQNFVYRPITRLDRDTSGLCLIAKNKLAASNFAMQINAGQVARTYIGVVKGNVYRLLTMDEAFKKIPYYENFIHLDFLIDIPIKRENEGELKRVVAPDGEKAITKVTALRYDAEKDVSICKFKLYTGRTHQIRVHMQHIGYPIIGDFLYNPDYTYIDRQALHANEIIFRHPLTNTAMRFVAKMPEDLKKLI
ncbi:MAG: RluA family pseudouridine synthase [Lachnospiraceae bacterium]|nr:RluA family pseudouridine synthase [Lachnospiraceae bacterium]